MELTCWLWLTLGTRLGEKSCTPGLRTQLVTAVAVTSKVHSMLLGSNSQDEFRFSAFSVASVHREATHGRSEMSFQNQMRI